MAGFAKKENDTSQLQLTFVRYANKNGCPTMV
jgi:hypothetical protein